MENRFDSSSLLEAVACDSELRLVYGFVRTPLGRCLLAVSAGRVGYLAFAAPGSDANLLADLAARWPGASLQHAPQQAEAAATAIFAPPGARPAAVKLLVRGTPFQLEVWRALLDIPSGTQCTYAEVARRVGRPRASRAVGSAIGANPIAWLIPCHRVIRSDGQLGGYRWGATMKRACLDFDLRRMVEHVLSSS